MLRCVAAILVVLFHTETIAATHMAHPPFGGMFSGGSHGVDLFFMLSGFIIGYVHNADVGQPNRLANYAFNRAARIFPAVWIMSSLALASYVVGYGGAAKAVLLPQLGDALVNVTWTLKFEIFFYLIFGASILNRRLGFALLLLWQLGALVLGSLFSTRQLDLAGFYFSSLCLEFGIGVVCAWLLDTAFMTNRDGFQNSVLLWPLSLMGAVMIILGMAGVSEAGDPNTNTGGAIIATHAWSINILCALGSGLLIVSLILLEQTDRLNVPKVLVFLGNASYSIYIVHFSVVTLVLGLIARWRIPTNDFVCLGVASIGIFVGLMFHIFIDRPIQKILRAKVRPAVVRLASA